MIPLVIRLPLDPTGTNPDNLVAREPHVLSTKRLRAIATKSGAFYSTSLVLYDDSTGQQLRKDQYYAAEMYQLPTKQYGKEVCAIIMITDPVVSTNVSVTYQAVGGIFSTSQEAIIAQIERLQIDTRPVAWGDIIGKPDGFTPSAHLHDAGDIYGFEYVVFALERIRDAIALGDAASHDAIYRYVDNLEAVLRALIAQSSGSITAHVNNRENPHGVTAAQLNVFTKPETSNLIAQSIASVVAALNGRIDGEVAALNNADAQINTRIDAHISNTNNPHGMTAAQLGVWTNVETQAAISQAVAASSQTINERITAEVNSLSNTINAVNTLNVNKFDGLYRGHAAIATSGNASLMHVDCSGTVAQWFANTRCLKIYFHTSTNGSPVQLSLDGTGVLANLAQYNPDGSLRYAGVAAGQISDVYWNGGNEIIVLDALPPPVKESIEYYGTLPSVKGTDSICVANAGILDWKAVGGVTAYYSKDIGKLFYDAGPVRPFTAELNGQWMSKAAYPQLWAWAQSTGQVTLQQYYAAGMFFFVDIDASTFALPDLRNVFVRGYGTDDQGIARAVGYLQAHQLGTHNHPGSATTNGAHIHGSGWGESQPTDNRYGIYSNVRGPGSGKTDYDNFDNATSSNGDHTHAITVGFAGGPETRPVNVAMSPRIQVI